MKNTSFISMLIFLLCAAGFVQYLARAGERERVPSHRSLAEIPSRISNWQEINAQTLGAGQARELKADEYISRTYANDRGQVAYLFIAYYGSQRHRQTIHSPQNCIPASGWTMSNYRLHSLGGDRYGRDRRINEYIIAKDDSKMVALYWYQGRGRIVASDYLGRIYTVKDAMFTGRTDGAIVRVIVPMAKGDQAEEQARAAALDFTTRLLFELSPFIPD